MSEVVKKQICECKNCGNEAEMTITCSLPDEKKADSKKKKDKKEKVKGTAVCSHCGNEADMWIDL